MLESDGKVLCRCRECGGVGAFTVFQGEPVGIDVEVLAVLGFRKWRDIEVAVYHGECGTVLKHCLVAVFNANHLGGEYGETCIAGDDDCIGIGYRVIMSVCSICCQAK